MPATKVNTSTRVPAQTPHVAVARSRPWPGRTKPYIVLWLVLFVVQLPTTTAVAQIYRGISPHPTFTPTPPAREGSVATPMRPASSVNPSPVSARRGPIKTPPPARPVAHRPTPIWDGGDARRTENPRGGPKSRFRRKPNGSKRLNQAVESGRGGATVHTVEQRFAACTGLTIWVCPNGVPAIDATCSGTTEQPTELCFPGGTASFADEVLDFSPNYPRPDQIDPNFSEPNDARFEPDYEELAAAVGTRSTKVGAVSLGHGGSIRVLFTDNRLTNSGDSRPDLYVFEIGQHVEKFHVAIRPADADTRGQLAEQCRNTGGDFCGLGESSLGQPKMIDIDQFYPGHNAGALRFDAVSITDDLQDQGSDMCGNGCTPGADIDAIGAIESFRLPTPTVTASRTSTRTRTATVTPTRTALHLQQQVPDVPPTATATPFPCVELSQVPSGPNVYGYDEGIPMAIGKGIDPKDLTRSFQQCLDVDRSAPATLPDEYGFQRGTYKVQEITDRKELRDALGFDLSLAASSPTHSFNAAFSTSRDESFQDDSVVFVVSGVVDFGKHSLIEPRLRDKFQQMVDQPARWPEFFAGCGDAFVTGAQKEVRYAVVYEFRNLHSEKKRELSSRLRAAFSGGIGSFRGEAGLRALLRNLERRTETRIEAVVKGGGTAGIQLQRCLVRADLEQPREVKACIEQALENVNPETSVPVRYFVTPATAFGVKRCFQPGIFFRDERLAALFAEWEEMKILEKRLGSLLDEVDKGLVSPTGPGMDSTYVTQVRSLAGQVALQIQALENLASDCVADFPNDYRNCQTPSLARLPLCEGGMNHGLACNPDQQCPAGLCVGGTCAQGTRAGMVCSTHVGCGAGGTCTGLPRLGPRPKLPVAISDLLFDPNLWSFFRWCDGMRGGLPDVEGDGPAANTVNAMIRKFSPAVSASCETIHKSVQGGTTTLVLDGFRTYDARPLQTVEGLQVLKIAGKGPSFCAAASGQIDDGDACVFDLTYGAVGHGFTPIPECDEGEQCVPNGSPTRVNFLESLQVHDQLEVLALSSLGLDRTDVQALMRGRRVCRGGLQPGQRCDDGEDCPGAGAVCEQPTASQIWPRLKELDLRDNLMEEDILREPLPPSLELLNLSSNRLNGSTTAIDSFSVRDWIAPLVNLKRLIVTHQGHQICGGCAPRGAGTNTLTCIPFGDHDWRDEQKRVSTRAARFFAGIDMAMQMQQRPLENSVVVDYSFGGVQSSEFCNVSPRLCDPESCRPHPQSIHPGSPFPGYNPSDALHRSWAECLCAR